ncbi:MAG: efflux transporter protein [Hyphomicrobiales bacterium]|nr:efflux transporter protein [Hyphomicrobiales bacterium]
MRRVHLAASLTIALAMSASAFAQSAEDFYRGKRIDLVVGGNAGGVYDVVARSLARHMPAHLPGAPNIVVQNMPGAGSIKAAEWAATIAPRDGTAIVALYPGAIMQPLFEADRKYRFDARAFGWLGSADSGARMCVSFHTSNVRTLAGPQGGKFIVGATAAGGSTWDYAWMMKNLSGANIQVAPGYKGTPELAIAMERGEIDGICGYGLGALRAEKPDWFQGRKLNYLVQFSQSPDPELTALGAPPISQLVSGEALNVVNLILSQQAFARPYAAPPGVPADRLAALRKAFDGALASPQMKGEFERMNSPLSPLPGADLERIVNEVYAAPASLVAAASKAQQPPQ